MTALILHGVSGVAGKHWMQWLRDELVKLGIEVIMPTLPNSDNPDFSEWKKTILDLIKDVNLSGLIVFGHSLGNAAALEIIQDLDKPIKAFVSVAGFYEDYGSELNTEFMKKCDIDIKKAKEKIQNAFVIYGDDDPYVPQNILNNLAVGLDVEPIVIKNGGHLNTDAGFTELPVLIELIKKVT